MASSKVVTANTDLPYQSSYSCSLSSTLADLSKISPSMSMDDLLKLINPPFQPEPDSSANARSEAVGLIPRQESFSLPREMAARTVDEVWKEIVEGSNQMPVGSGEEGPEEEITLEDFLSKAGAVREEDVGGVPAVAVGADGGSHWAGATAFNGVGGGGGGFPAPSVPAFENGIEGSVVAGVAMESSRRGKRRVQQEPIMDRALLQKQRRMIKNRESAARSRERKQAYTSELEAMVSQLEKENAQLRKAEADRNMRGSGSSWRT
ncbi:ABSCISIC ACID-INSENSITIVE 5-like protein 2 [Prosopis cineraria]|uniref:ABSCISIC ACID-INSENSITIVE 5-like protein 2 n=1 Tax=Prosopis cineraria TaxID=364024 RepID=UPI0024106C75|nr:ABSCISIC ACID-INSENSITIVE 5-like protein 2 [Prosopis cineraria]